MTVGPAIGPQAADECPYQLTLYVNGASSMSRLAIARAKAFCEALLHDRYDLLVLDLQSHAAAAHEDGVIVTPTLIRTKPSPTRRFVGDLSRTDRVAEALGVAPATPIDLSGREAQSP